MDFTFELAKSFNVLPFEIMKQDKDEVIMLINYLIEKGDEDNSSSTNLNNNNNSGNNTTKRIRVNDKTASGGWY